MTKRKPPKHGKSVRQARPVKQIQPAKQVQFLKPAQPVEQQGWLMKRSTAITLALLGAGTVAVYGALHNSCNSNNWNDTQSCRSSSSHWWHFSGSSINRGGFGRSGAAHSAGS